MLRSLKLLGLVLLTVTTFKAHAGFAELPNGVNCQLSDLTESIDCVGVYSPGNDHGANIFEDQTFIDIFGDGWLELSKTEEENGNWDVGNLALTLFDDNGNQMVGEGSTSGSWQVDSWGDFQTGDVLAVIKAGQQAAAYELDLLFTGGLFDITGDHWTNDKGKNNAISHFSLWVHQSAIPEPNILAILALGLIGFGVMVKRK